MDPGATASANSSDFVRKLYRMLEENKDSRGQNIVRWGDDGSSFVVLENEAFTKSILPRHFKHSNFASFVRQLNKYDFHKVRNAAEEGGDLKYGAGAWEFKHPDFKANNKDALDNIRRKAPVPKKVTNHSTDDLPTQQMDLVNTQLVATQSQLQQLHDKYNELSLHHGMLLTEVMNLQKTVVNHEHVIQNVMNYLHSVDNQRRNSKVFSGNNPFGEAPNGSSSVSQAVKGSPGPENDEPASPLQNASKLLDEVQADELINSRQLEVMNENVIRLNGNISTPPPSESAYKPGAGRHGSREPPLSASSTGTMRYGELDSLVYPVGQTQGIDPMYSDHVNNIPYAMPNKSDSSSETRFQPPPSAQKKHVFDPGWTHQPQILLVEDDPTCRRIGGKFLYAFKCSVDNALDGLEAVNKLHGGAKYDLILMDIIMPNLDGVSACHIVRQFDNTPIIAMTSNIRSDDISMYFEHGMNDVLPKPFTKEGLLAMLDKHLAHLKKDITGPPGHSTGRHSLKEEESSSKGSPTTMNASWNSPAQLTGISPAQSNIPDDYMSSMRNSQAYEQNRNMQYGSNPITPVPGQRAQSGSHRRHVSDISGGDDPSVDPKRHQMYAPHMQMHGR